MTEVDTARDRSALRPRDRDAILQALRAGVVPRRGHQHIQVGRSDEVAALVKDIDRVADGGSALRFVIGEFGSGKTFFLHLVRSIAMRRAWFRRRPTFRHRVGFTRVKVRRGLSMPT